MFKLSNYPLLQRLSDRDETTNRRIRLAGYVFGVALCYMSPDEWFQAAGLWLRAGLTVVLTRLGLR